MIPFVQSPEMWSLRDQSRPRAQEPHHPGWMNRYAHLFENTLACASAREYTLTVI
jgi:hypothetical protein